MSILSDRAIVDAIADGLLEITPFSHDRVRPASVDLHLGALVTIADPNEPDGWRVHDLRERPFRLDRGTFVLAATLERVRLGDPTRPETCTLAGILAGKSSRAREGIQVEAAGYVDPGWDGELTIEVTRFRPGTSILTIGLPICQIRFETLYSHPLRPYGSDASSHYQGSKGPVLSRTGGLR